MGNSIHILLIEDDPAHAELIQRAIEDRGNGARLTIHRGKIYASHHHQVKIREEPIINENIFIRVAIYSMY